MDLLDGYTLYRNKLRITPRALENRDRFCERYRELLLTAIPDGEWRLIREAIHQGELTGDRRFVDKVESILGRRIEKRMPGRPRKDNGQHEA